MILGIVLHALFGALLSAFFWLFALSSWFSGGKPGFWGSAAGFWVLFTVGVIVGGISYVGRDKKLIDTPYDDAADGKLFWKRVPVIVIAIIGAYFIWTFVSGK